jgi:hypothetical protein
MEFEIGIIENAGLKLFMKKQLRDNIREFQYSLQEYFILSVFYFFKFFALVQYKPFIGIWLLVPVTLNIPY